MHVCGPSCGHFGWLHASGVMLRHFIHLAHLRQGHVVEYGAHLHLAGKGLAGGNGGGSERGSFKNSFRHGWWHMHAVVPHTFLVISSVHFIVIVVMHVRRMHESPQP